MKNFVRFIIITVLFTVLITVGQEKPDEIIFSHRLHVEDLGAECESCHSGAFTSMSPTDNLQPEMATCYNCHDEEAECGLCHTNTDEPGISRRYVDYKSKFPHKTHVEDEASCLTCHEGIEKQEVFGAVYVPERGYCANCHPNADFSEERFKCLECHDPDMRFVPADHRLNWKKDHGVTAQIASNSCSHCHQNNYCQKCHDGDNLDRMAHPLNFRNNHGLLARGNKENCMTCHQEQAFCVDCHQIEMVMPKNHSYVNWSNRIPGNGGRHAMEAKYDLDNCMSCHNDAFTDVVCVTCHGN